MASPDYEGMRACIKQADDALSQAASLMAGMDRMAQMESYILGHLRACQSVLAAARDALDQAAALKRKRKAATKSQ